MKLFIDDERYPVEPGWVYVSNAKDAITELRLCRDRGERIEHVSYDHDLGEQTSRDVMNWQARNGVYPEVASIHSSNPVGREWLTQALLNDFDEAIPIVEAPEYVRRQNI